jgi:hypothetical protein
MNISFCNEELDLNNNTLDTDQFLSLPPSPPTYLFTTPIDTTISSDLDEPQYTPQPQLTTYQPQPDHQVATHQVELANKLETLSNAIYKLQEQLYQVQNSFNAYVQPPSSPLIVEVADTTLSVVTFKISKTTMRIRCNAIGTLHIQQSTVLLSSIY